MREIDKKPTLLKRPKEMQVLCLGLSRTATMSLLVALKQLGYTPYHGSELFKNAKHRHNQCWQEGLTEKYKTGKSYGCVEFDKLLGEYDAVTDCPCANFPEELVSAYPDAKVILTTRDPDRWVKSMESCYYQILDMLSWNPITYLEPNEWGAFQKLVNMVLTHLTSGQWDNREALKQGFLEHNSLVRSFVPKGLVPKERFLDFQSEQGWGPLCKFLGKPVPDTPYPNINSGTEAARLTKDLCRYVLFQKLMAAMPFIVGIIVIILGLLFWRK